MIILNSQYPFDTKGETEISQLSRKSSRRDSITGYLISTQSRYTRWRFNCNLLVGKQDLETLQQFFAEQNGSFDFVDWRGFSWLTASGTNNDTHAYSTGALFDQDSLQPQVQQGNGYQACGQTWIVPVNFIINARGLSGTPAGDSGEVALEHEVPAGTINSINAVFTLSQSPDVLILFKNGVEQKLTVDYNLSGSTITFVVGAIPTTGSSLDAYYTV